MTVAEAPVAERPPRAGRAWSPVLEGKGRVFYGLALGVAFAAMAQVMAFGNPTRLLSHTPGDLGDPMFTQWIMRWNVHALFSAPFDVFDPNMYWPSQNTLLYSDTLLAVTPLAAVLGAVFGWPVSYNLLYVGCAVASLVSTYLLAHWVTGNRGAAVVAGVVFAFAAPRLVQYAHFQLGFGFLIPLGLWLLLRFLTERRWWQAAALGVVLGAVFLQATYYALALYVAVAVVVAGWLVVERFRPGPRFVAGLAVAAVVAAVIAGPAAYKYAKGADIIRRGYSHEWATHPGDLLAPANGSYLWATLDRWAERGQRSHEVRAFPGAVAVLLGGVGALELLRRRRRPRPEAGPDLETTATDTADPTGPSGSAVASADLRKRALILVLVASAVVGILGMGRYLDIGGLRLPLPYAVARKLVPGFESIRVVGRFVIVPLLGLSLLAAWGFRRLTAGRPGRVVGVAAAAVALVMMAEYAIRIPLQPRIDRAELTAANRALDDLPDGPVVELPMADAREFVWGLVEPPRLLLSAVDWNPRVNGYGADHYEYLLTHDLMATLDDGDPVRPDALARLQQLGVRYLLIRTAPMLPSLDIPGVTHFDAAAADRVVAALPADRVARVTRPGAAVLIELRR